MVAGVGVAADWRHRAAYATTLPAGRRDPIDYCGERHVVRKRRPETRMRCCKQVCGDARMPNHVAPAAPPPLPRTHTRTQSPTHNSFGAGRRVSMQDTRLAPNALAVSLPRGDDPVVSLARAPAAGTERQPSGAPGPSCFQTRRPSITTAPGRPNASASNKLPNRVE